jgi:para-nitrobenzyl esterase
MTRRSSRRVFAAQAGVFLARLYAGRGTGFAADAAAATVVAATAAGKVRGIVANGVRIFKGVPYGGTTAGRNRFKPPTPPTPWTGTRDAFEWGSSAPQTVPP